MPLTPPTPAQIGELAAQAGFSLGPADLDWYASMLREFLTSYQLLDALPDDLPRVTYARDPGYAPQGAENRYNAWYYKTAIHGAASGKLKGRTVVLKDNVMLAGVPMMNGSSVLQGYVPDIDATIVTRILDAGGEIVGKAHCECFCLSAGSHTNFTGPVHNPRRPGYSAGGSSSGSAALVASGDVDMAIGCDQGGSIRVPSAFCGTYGLKPTYGLVPYTGIVPIEATIDHVGPITHSVRDNALLLEVIAGADGYDPRQCAPAVHAYVDGLAGGVAGMKIALLTEGFGQPTSEPDVDTKVRAAAERLQRLGAVVEAVSIPTHHTARLLSGAVTVEGIVQTLLHGDGFGTGRSDVYVTSLMGFMRRWRERADELPETIKLAVLLGSYVERQYGHRYYGKAMNLVRGVTAAYDAVLARYDLLLMPTTPMKATPLPGPAAKHAEILQRAFEPIANTAPFNLTHHPAMSVPCGMSDGLPVGMMLVGRHYDEPSIYRAAFAFEQAADWTAL